MSKASKDGYARILAELDRAEACFDAVDDIRLALREARSVGRGTGQNGGGRHE